MKNLIVLLIGGTLFMSSCAVSNARITTSRSINASHQNVVIKPLVAEVKVDINKKITGTATVKNGNVEQAKELAKWNALETSGADIIIDPVFDVTISTMTVTATVSGFHGKYISIETVKDEDLEKLEKYQVSSGKKEASVVNKLNKLKTTD